jgi:hypothetical protein
MLSDVDQLSEKVYRKEKIIFVPTEPTSAAQAGKKLLHRQDKTNGPTQKGLLSYVTYSLSRHLLQFQQSEGATPLWSL